MSEWLPWLLPSPVHVLALLVMLALVVRARRRQQRPRRHWPMTVLLTVVLTWAWVGSTPGFADLALRQLEGPMPERHRDPLPDIRPDPRTLILVLGSGEMHAPDGRTEVRLNIQALERLRLGVDLWRRTGGRIVLAGGPGPAVDASIAGAMARWVEGLGVPSSALVLVSDSHTTYEDIMGANKQLGAEAWSVGDAPRFLVTSAMHMPRALAVAQHAGMSVQPLKADYRQIRRLTLASWWPDPRAMRRWLPVVHEYVGLLGYRWRGWA